MALILSIYCEMLTVATPNTRRYYIKANFVSTSHTVLALESVVMAVCDLHAYPQLALNDLVNPLGLLPIRAAPNPNP